MAEIYIRSINRSRDLIVGTSFSIFKIHKKRRNKITITNFKVRHENELSKCYSCKGAIDSKCSYIRNFGTKGVDSSIHADYIMRRKCPLNYVVGNDSSYISNVTTGSKKFPLYLSLLVKKLPWKQY